MKKGDRNRAEEEWLIAIGFLLLVAGLVFVMRDRAWDRNEDSRMNAIMGNLRQVSSAGLQYLMKEGHRSVTASQLVKQRYLNQLPETVHKESYDHLTVYNAGVLSIDADLAGTSTSIFYTY